MEEFIQWYCSEPRLALNRSVVLRYRLQLEGAQLAPATINVRLAAISRLAYEAADGGLLSPDLVAGIRRVKGVKRLGHRTGNWLSVGADPVSIGSCFSADDGAIFGLQAAAEPRSQRPHWTGTPGSQLNLHAGVTIAALYRNPHIGIDGRMKGTDEG